MSIEGRNLFNQFTRFVFFTLIENITQYTFQYYSMLLYLRLILERISHSTFLYAIIFNSISIDSLDKNDKKIQIRKYNYKTMGFSITNFAESL